MMDSRPGSEGFAVTVKEAFRARGWRWTGERQAILRVALGMEAHFTPEDVQRALSRQGIRVSPVTVYRNLPVLCEAGILRRTCLSSQGTTYEKTVDSDHHDHLICEGCGRVVEFQYEAIEVLQELVASRHGFVLSRHHLELLGRCPSCQGHTPTVGARQVSSLSQ